jgi:sestrin
VGGEKAWLEGIHRAPPKLRRLVSMNKVLAVRPWSLEQAHLKELTTGQQSWSIAEIVQAIGKSILTSTLPTHFC